MRREKEEIIKKINDFNVNGRKYVIYELIKNKKYYPNGCYAVMFDDNGEHGLYVAYNDLTKNKIEQAFRDLGYIEPEHKVTVDKAVEWLSLNAELYGGFNHGKLTEMLEQFKKAMEG